MEMIDAFSVLSVNDPLDGSKYTFYSGFFPPCKLLYNYTY